MTSEDATTSRRRPGRPPGSGPVARLRSRLLEGGKVDALIDKTYALALAGDVAAIRILLDRVLPPIRATAAPIAFDLPASGLTDQARAILAASAAGTIPTDQAAELIAALGRVARVEEVDELRRRLDALDGGDPS